MLKAQLQRLTQAIDEEDYQRAVDLLEAMLTEAERLERALHYEIGVQRRHPQRELL